ncbi:MAG: DUF6020 family protein [Lachnospiraceae bacterium]|nr:DUF6020 family protein [Lachnospiraceae bacterium]
MVLTGKKRFLVWPIMLLCWIPCYISYFPGIYAYDIPFQHLVYLGQVPWNNHQPLIHTLFWGLCWGFENLVGYHPAALIMYAVLQMIMLSGLLSYVVLRMYRFGKAAPLVAFIWYALNPVLVIFSFVTTKDVLFSGLFMVWLMILMDLYSSKKEIVVRDVIPFVIIGLLACLLRKNVPYVMLLTAFIFLGLKKTRLFFAILATTAMSVFVTSGIYNWAGVLASSDAEMLSVPMTQLASVYNDEGAMITDRDREGIEYYMDPSVFNPRLADPLKISFNTDRYDKDKFRFWKLYLNVLFEEPVRMINAGLTLDEPYWNPLLPFPDPYAQLRYIETYISVDTQYKTECAGLLPKIHRIYDSFARHDNKFTNSRYTGWLFSLWFPIWFIFGCMIICIIRGRHEFRCIFIPVFILFATYLLGPVANFRYLYTFELVMPIAACAALSREGTTVERYS